MQHNTQVPVGKHNNRQHAPPYHEVATDVKQMPIRPIIIIIIIKNILEYLGDLGEHHLGTGLLATLQKACERIFKTFL